MSNANDPQAQTGNDTQTDAAAPQYVTEEQLGKIVGNIVNSAVTSQLGRALPKMLESALNPIREQLQARPAEHDPKSDTDKAKQNPEFVALQKRLNTLESALADKEREVAEERKRSREDKAFADLTQSLVGKVRPGSEQTVAKLLRADGQLVIGDDGAPSLKVRTSLFKGGAEDDHVFPLKDGIDHYLKTKDASLFLPPPNGGAGGTNQQAPNGSPAHRPGPRYDAPPASPEEKLARVNEELSRLGLGLP